MDKPIAPSRRGNWKLLALVAALGLALMLSLGLLVFGGKPEQGSGSEPDWSTVVRGPLKLQSAGTGEFISTRQRILTAAEQGTVEEILRKSGDTVVEQDVILRLRNPQLALDLEAAESDLKHAETSAQQVIADDEMTIEEARSAAADARIALEVAEAERLAYENLLKQQIVSRLQYQQVEAKRRQSRNALDSAEHKLAILRRQQGRLRSGLFEGVHLATIKRDSLRSRIAGLEVRASRAGLVKSVDVRLGDSVPAGTQLAMVGPKAPDAARLRFPQRDLPQLRVGMRVSLAFNEAVATGVIARISPDPEDGYVTAEVECNRLPAGARIGMAVRGNADLDSLDDAVYARSGFEPSGPAAAIDILRDRNGDVSKMHLTNVRASNGFLIFADGLAPGDRIAVVPEL